VDYWKDLHGIEIQLDDGALARAGLGSETPITGTIKGISLRAALRNVLRKLDLAFVVKDEVLLVTTADEAARHTVRKVYPVDDLMLPARAVSGAAGGSGLSGPPNNGLPGFPGIDGAGLNFPGFNNPGLNGQGINGPPNGFPGNGAGPPF
jgi:hypothetical protein